MKGKAPVTANEAQTPVESGLKIRTSLKAGRIIRNVNRTVVARKKVRLPVSSPRKAASR